jgi:hypothetical protein
MNVSTAKNKIKRGPEPSSNYFSLSFKTGSQDSRTAECSLLLNEQQKP